MRAYINIGSNLGDRAAHIERAVVGIEKALGAPAQRSDVMESEPWGFDSGHRFLNLGIAIDTTLEPSALLNTLLGVQRSIDASAHRTISGGYADRSIDIDLIALDDMVVESPMLTLPHPRMAQRLFVLAPMAQIAPDWRHPVSGLTCRQMMAILSNS